MKCIKLEEDEGLMVEMVDFTEENDAGSGIG